MNVNTLKVTDPDFPQALINIPSPPKQIYWSGHHPKEWINFPKVAIVGSRKVTPYGRKIAQKLAGELAKSGVVIISGLAFGIDVIAHQAALESGGLTAAVLGSNLGRISPASHLNVARQIMEQGTIISEYPLGSDTYAGNFVVRNRIISGLADAVVIPEAALKSGSLHTARFALEQGKTVMAVPGNIDSAASEGCNNLIKSGAIPVTSADDIFFALKLNPAAVSPHRIFRGSEQEEVIYRLIEDGVADQEQIALSAQIDGQTLAGTLTMLEISGYIRPAGSGSWTIA